MESGHIAFAGMDYLAVLVAAVTNTRMLTACTAMKA